MQINNDLMEFGRYCVGGVSALCATFGAATFAIGMIGLAGSLNGAFDMTASNMQNLALAGGIGLTTAVVCGLIGYKCLIR